MLKFYSIKLLLRFNHMNKIAFFNKIVLFILISLIEIIFEGWFKKMI